MRNDRKNVIVEKTFEFSLGIIEYADLLESKRKYVLGNQIIKSGTSIGANTREAQNAESKADFIHKFKISAKEADEIQYWLDLCKSAKSYPDPPQELFVLLQDIIKIISKIIASSKR
ncbi:four helix bundle protein [soil metagenome]